MAAHEKDAAWTRAKKKSEKMDWTTFFGRFSEININQSLTADPHSQKKLEVLLGENLPTVIETEDCMSSPRDRLPAGNLTIGDRSPIEITLKGQPPIGNQTVATSARRILFPSEEKRAAAIPLLPNSIKVSECTITLEDIKAARKKERKKSSSAFNGLSAKLLAIAWGTDYDEETRLEGTHLRPKMWNGEVDRSNMVIASFDANTKMFVYDNSMQYLLQHGLCQYVVVRISCTLRQKANSSEFTHHAETIQITYETDNGLKFESPVINANLTVQPSVAEAKLIKKLIIATQSALLKKGTEACIAEMNTRIPSRADEEENKALNSASLEDAIPRDWRNEPESKLSREDDEQKDIIPPEPRKSERLLARNKNMGPLEGDQVRKKQRQIEIPSVSHNHSSFNARKENLPPNTAINYANGAGPKKSAGGGSTDCTSFPSSPYNGYSPGF
jgi:hypothetical protein